MVTACAIFAIQGLAIKLAAIAVPVFEIVLVMGMCSAFLTAAIARSVGVIYFFGKVRNLPLIILRGAFAATSVICGIYSLALIDLGEQTTLYFMAPAITLTLAYFFLREPMGWKVVLGVTLTLTGAVVVAHPAMLFPGSPKAEYPNRPAGIVLALCSAVFDSRKSGGWPVGLGFFIILFTFFFIPLVRS